MTRALVLALIAAAALPACTRMTPEQQAISDAATALGGRDRILAAKTLVIEGGGTVYSFGQDVVPGATGETYTVTNYRRAIDLASGHSQIERTQTPNFAFYQGPQPQTQKQRLDGWTQHPLLAVRAALDPKATLANARTEGGQSLVDVTAADGSMFTLAIDATSKLPTRASIRQDDTNLGDTVQTVEYSAYQDAGGLKVPATLVSRIDEFTTTRINVAKQTVDGDAGDLAAPAPAGGGQGGQGGGGQPPMVTATQVAPGITLLAGGSHHSVLVEFTDHLMLIEAPQNEGRAMAVMAKARELVPNKPLTQLVNTHHHFDHSGGVRAAIAEGLAVITHQGNVAFFEDVAKRPHTLKPDALAKAGKPLVIEGISDQKTFSDGKMTVTLFTESGQHSQTMLYAYFPREKVLVEADVYTPGSTVHMFAPSFLTELKQRNLRIDKVVPLHGPVATYAQFLKDAALPVPPVNAGA